MSLLIIQRIIVLDGLYLLLLTPDQNLLRSGHQMPPQRVFGGFRILLENRVNDLLMLVTRSFQTPHVLQLIFPEGCKLQPQRLRCTDQIPVVATLKQ